MKKSYSFLIGILVLFIINTAMAQKQTAKVLVLIYSDDGGTYELAKEIAKGIESGQNVQATIKQVKASDNPKLKNNSRRYGRRIRLPMTVIAFGSPVYFGNISTGMSEFLFENNWSMDKPRFGR